METEPIDMDTTEEESDDKDVSHDGERSQGTGSLSEHQHQHHHRRVAQADDHDNDRSSTQDGEEDDSDSETGSHISRERTNYYLKRSGRVTNDGCLVPKNKPNMKGDGLYKRPRGRQPEGMDWDDIRGVWIPLDTAEVNDGSVLPRNRPQLCADGSYKRPRGRHPDGMDWDQWKGIWIQSEETRKPVIIVPKKRPRMGIDGTFIRPVGTVPEDMTWDNARGVWIREGASREEYDDEEQGDYEEAPSVATPESAEAPGSLVAPGSAALGIVAATPTPKTNGHSHSLSRSRSVLSGKRLKPTYDGFNPNSPWQEPIRPDDDVTLFDVNRKPRAIMTGRIQRPVKSFSNFHCVICLGYIRNARIVMECLHRFCEDCIEKSLRMGRNECPICRTFVPSRRSLVPDPNFDRLIRSILGDFVVDERSKEDSEEAVTLSSPLQQAIHRKKKATVLEKRQKDKGGPQEKVESNPVQGKPIPLVALLLQKHSQERQAEELVLPFLRLQGNANIGTLKTFLCRKLDRPFSVFQILTTSGGKESALNDWTTLEVAATEQMKSMKEASGANPDYPTFFYRIKKM